MQFLMHHESVGMVSITQCHNSTDFRLPFVETMYLSCTISEIQQVICWKSQIFPTPHIWQTHWADPTGISSRRLASQNQSS